MPRRVILIALFVGLWFVGDRLGSRLLGVVLDRSNEPIARLYGGRGAADVVLLGNSRAYRNLDAATLAREFGGPVANLAQPGASMEISGALFEDYLERYGPPRVVVLEMSALFTDSGGLKDLRLYSARSDRIAALVKAHFPELHYGGLVSRLFDYNSPYALNVAHKLVAPMPSLLLEGAWQASRDFPAGRYFSPRRENVEAGRRLIAAVRRCGIDARLVLSPVVPGYGAANDIASLREATGAIADGIRVWDLADGPPAEPRFFVDPSHLNRTGAGAFAAALKERGFFQAPGAARPARCP